jgi:hypothetical protein
MRSAKKILVTRAERKTSGQRVEDSIKETECEGVDCIQINPVHTSLKVL